MQRNVGQYKHKLWLSESIHLIPLNCARKQTSVSNCERGICFVALLEGIISLSLWLQYLRLVIHRGNGMG